MAMMDHVCKSMCGRAMYKQTALLYGYDGSCVSQCAVGPCINKLLCCMAMIDHVCMSMCCRPVYKQTTPLCGYDRSCMSVCVVGQSVMNCSVVWL